MQVASLPVGMLQVNCYLVWAKDTREALVIDPGDEAERISAEIATRHLTPRGILLTHAHVDHIRGVPGVAREFRIPVWFHPGERDLYFSPANALPPWVPAAADLPDPAPEPPRVNGLDFQVLETPGHTEGGVGYYFPAAGMLFSGDTLFQGSIGRTDFPGGDLKALMASIRNVLLRLPPETRVFPGHGEPTTIGDEARLNPYLVWNAGPRADRESE